MTFLTVKYHDWQSAPMFWQQKKFYCIAKVLYFFVAKTAIWFIALHHIRVMELCS